MDRINLAPLVANLRCRQAQVHWSTTRGCVPGSYPSHSVSESPFSDALGSGRQLTVTCSGLRGSPDLIYVLQLYTQNPYGTIQVRVRNGTGKATSVQAIRSVEATGDSILSLGGRQSDDRILSDSFSEDWPDWSSTISAVRRTECIAESEASLSITGKANRACFLAHLPRIAF